MSTTYSLSEVADELRLFEAMKDPVRWLTKQIALGRIRAGRYGRSWRMTRTQIDAAVDAFASTASMTHPVELKRVGLSAASMRRRAS